MYPDIGLAANALTTLDAVKQLLQIPEIEVKDDNNLTRLINAASAWVETMTGRKFGRREYVQRCIGSGQQELILDQFPVISVESVMDCREQAAFSPESYFTDQECGILFRDMGWPQIGYTGGLAYDLIRPSRYIEIRYTAGYILPKDGTEEEPATLPTDLESIVWQIVQQEYTVAQNSAQGLSAFSISDVSWTFDKEPRSTWKETINRYRRLCV